MEIRVTVILYGKVGFDLLISNERYEFWCAKVV